MNSKIPMISLVAAIGIAGCVMSGCASVKAMPESKQSAEGLLRWPSEIYVKPFDTSSGKWEGNTAREPKRTEVRDWLMAELERNLAEIAPARILTVDALPNSGLLVTGRFIRVNPGSKFARMFVGLGAGGSRLETKISVFDLAVSSKEPLMTFTTTGGSNLAAGPQTVFNNDSEGDIERTAREARDFLRAHLGSRDSARPPASPAQGMEAVEAGKPAASGVESQGLHEQPYRKPSGRP